MPAWRIPMNTRTVTREQTTTIRRRPNKTTKRVRHKTTAKGYGVVADAVARTAAGLSAAAFSVFKSVSSRKPIKRLRKTTPMKALEKGKPMKAVNKVVK
jgi:hypothetical protein